jgi:hypothetical protein
VKFASLAIVAAIALTGCDHAYVVKDPRDDSKVLAVCYSDASNALCRVEDTDRKTVTTGQGYLSALGGAASLFALFAKP